MNSRNGYNSKVVVAFFHSYGVPEPVFEFQFEPTRRWKFDMSWIVRDFGNPDIITAKVFLEVQGSIFTGGRHTRGPALLHEYEKLNRASVLGWRGLFVTPQQLLTKQTVNMVRVCLGLCPVPDKRIGMAKSV